MYVCEQLGQLNYISEETIEGTLEPLEIGKHNCCSSYLHFIITHWVTMSIHSNLAHNLVWNSLCVDVQTADVKQTKAQTRDEVDTFNQVAHVTQVKTGNLIILPHHLAVYPHHLVIAPHQLVVLYHHLCILHHHIVIVPH